MAAPRVDIAPDKQALKAASKALIRAGGGVECGIGRVGKSKLSEYGQPDNDAFMPVDVIADFEDDTHGTAGHPIMTRWLAKRQGYGLVKLPSGELPTGGALHQFLADSVREAGALHSTVCEALRDGRVTPGERDSVRAAAIQAAEKHMQLAAILEQLTELG